MVPIALDAHSTNNLSYNLWARSISDWLLLLNNIAVALSKHLSFRVVNVNIGEKLNSENNAMTIERYLETPSSCFYECGKPY